MRAQLEEFIERMRLYCVQNGITAEEYARRYNDLTPDQITAALTPRDTLQRLDAWLKGGTGRKVAAMASLDSAGVVVLISEDRYGPPYTAQHHEGIGDTPEAALADALDKIGAAK